MDKVRVSGAQAMRMPAAASAHLAIATAMATPVLLASLRLLSPEFDPSYRLMSEYAFGSHGWVLSLTFLCWGVSSWAMALAIRFQIRARAARVGLALLVVAGCGQILAAVFDIRNDIGHNLAGTMGLVGLPVAAVLISQSLGQLRLTVLAHLTWISLVLWIASFVLLIVTMLHVNGSLPAQAPPSLPPGVVGVVGWTNRLLVVMYCAWTVAAAVYSIRLRKHGMR
jgi:hypothetical protein